jgi:F-type H+-transporting ATPase subunit gamma
MPGQITKIKSKIKSTKTTKKITKAMELVSSSKMKQFQKKAYSTQEFEKQIQELLKITLDYDFENKYYEKRKSGDIVFILYTSDKGLCGGLNTKLIKTLLNSKEWIKTPKNERVLITIGKKGYDYAKNNNIDILKHFNNLDEKLTHSNSIEIIDSIIKIWEEKSVKGIYMISPNFRNFLIYYPVIKKFLPIEKDIESEIDLELSEENYLNPNIIFEPNAQEFLDSLFHKLIYAKFYAAFMELKATEYSSRMISMQNATKSAEGIIDKLSLKYNNARQASITQEIAEIVSGGI